MDWNKNGDGIIYNAYKQDGVTDGSETTANKNQLLFYHKLGDKQENDTQIGCYPRNIGFTQYETTEVVAVQYVVQISPKATWWLTILQIYSLFHEKFVYNTKKLATLGWQIIGYHKNNLCYRGSVLCKTKW